MIAGASVHSDEEHGRGICDAVYLAWFQHFLGLCGCLSRDFEGIRVIPGAGWKSVRPLFAVRDDDDGRVRVDGPDIQRGFASRRLGGGARTRIHRSGFIHELQYDTDEKLSPGTSWTMSMGRRPSSVTMAKWPRRRQASPTRVKRRPARSSPHLLFPRPLRPMLSFEYEEDSIHDPNIAMDIDSDDLDDAQGDIDIDADGVVDYEQDVSQRYSSPYETQVASTSKRTVSADLISSLNTHLYMATLLDPPHRRIFRSSFYAFCLKHTLTFIRDTRTTLTRPRRRRMTTTTPPTATRNMAPRRKRPRRGNNPPNPRVLPATISSRCTPLTSPKPQSRHVHLVHPRGPTPTQIMALDPRRRREFVRLTKLE